MDEGRNGKMDERMDKRMDGGIEGGMEGWMERESKKEKKRKEKIKWTSYRSSCTRELLLLVRQCCATLLALNNARTFLISWSPGCSVPMATVAASLATVLAEIAISRVATVVGRLLRMCL